MVQESVQRVGPAHQSGRRRQSKDLVGHHDGHLDTPFHRRASLRVIKRVVRELIQTLFTKGLRALGKRFVFFLVFQFSLQHTNLVFILDNQLNFFDLQAYLFQGFAEAIQMLAAFFRFLIVLL